MTRVVLGCPNIDGAPPSQLQKETFDSCHTQAPRQRRHGVEARSCALSVVCAEDGYRTSTQQSR